METDARVWGRGNRDDVKKVDQTVSNEDEGGGGEHFKVGRVLFLSSQSHTVKQSNGQTVKVKSEVQSVNQPLEKLLRSFSSSQSIPRL